MSKLSFFAGLFGLPIVLTLLLVGVLTPAYVPSDSLIGAAASTSSPERARDRMIASFVGRCRSGWNLSSDRLIGRSSLYSWENDAGLLARTEIVCMPGERCTVTAVALMAWPFPNEINGKPVPTRIWGCGRVPPNWLKQTTS